MSRSNRIRILIILLAMIVAVLLFVCRTAYVDDFSVVYFDEKTAEQNHNKGIDFANKHCDEFITVSQYILETYNTNDNIFECIDDTISKEYTSITTDVSLKPQIISVTDSERGVLYILGVTTPKYHMPQSAVSCVYGLLYIKKSDYLNSWENDNNVYLCTPISNELYVVSYKSNNYQLSFDYWSNNSIYK